MKKAISNPYLPMDYDTLLKNAPSHDSEEFLEYLKRNNPVEFESKDWLIIRNFKYSKPDRLWLTAFYKPVLFTPDWMKALNTLMYRYNYWTWLRKPIDKQSVKRFHIHLIHGEL